jgi:hypothetical protein
MSVAVISGVLALAALQGALVALVARAERTWLHRLLSGSSHKAARLSSHSASKNRPTNARDDKAP